MTALPRPPHPAPRFATVMKRPSLRHGMGANIQVIWGGVKNISENRKPPIKARDCAMASKHRRDDRIREIERVTWQAAKEPDADVRSVRQSHGREPVRRDRRVAGRDRRAS